MEPQKQRLAIDLIPLWLSGVTSFVDTVRWLREHNEPLSVDDLRYLAMTNDCDESNYSFPLHIARFIAELLRSREAMNMLDPDAGLGLLGAYIAFSRPLFRADLVCREVVAKEILHPVLTPHINLHIGGFSDVQNTLTGSYDAIISIPRMTDGRSCRTFPVSGGEVNISGNASEFLILDAARHLSDEGVLVFVMPDSFARDVGPESLRHNLPKFGLHLTAMLRILPRTFDFEPELSTELAIIERIDRGPFFFAAFPCDYQSQDELIAYLQTGGKGLQVE